MDQVIDALIKRHAATNRKNSYGNDQRPEIQILAVPKGVFKVGGLLTLVYAEQHETAVSGDCRNDRRSGFVFDVLCSIYTLVESVGLTGLSAPL
jgi:hypothetical protein